MKHWSESAMTPERGTSGKERDSNGLNANQTVMRRCWEGKDQGNGKKLSMVQSS